jgi:hypothetical protein
MAKECKGILVHSFHVSLLHFIVFLKFFQYSVFIIQGFIRTVSIMFILHVSYFAPSSVPSNHSSLHLKQLQEISLFYFI